MVLARSVPDGVGARHARALRRSVTDRPRLRAAVGGAGLIPLTAFCLATTLQALRVRSLVTAYESAHGSAGHAWRSAAGSRPTEFDQLRLTLDSMVAHPGWTGGVGLLYFLMFPVSLVVAYGCWLGISRLALRDRPVARRNVMVAGAAVVVLQLVFLTHPMIVFNDLTG